MAESFRLQQLQAMLADDPDDPFLHYGIAMEHAGLGNDESAIAGFQKLLRLSPDYVPPYLMLGQLLQKHGRIDEAVQVLRDGCGVARRVGNEHALSEMMGLLAILE
jgi:predicted Zn-dependent protease